MGCRLEQLRLAVALVHAVPGARLLLRGEDGGEVTVGSHPAADLDPCSLRRLLLRDPAPAAIGSFEARHVGGALEAIGGGLHRRIDQGRQQRWSATTLHPARVWDVLARCGPADLPAEVMRAHLKPDPGLGVTVMCLTCEDTAWAHRLDDAAFACVSSTLAEELVLQSVGDHRWVV